MAPKVYLHSFRAMGTIYTLGLVAEDAYWAWRRLVWARLQVASWERRYSRFRPDSELSRLNRSPKPYRVSRSLAALVKHGVRAEELSGGLFSMAVLPNLEAAGYAGSWRRHGPRGYSAGQPVCVAPLALRLLPGCRVDLGGGRIDLGGLAKGWVADQLARRLGATGGAFVDAGGDVALVGHPPDQAGWLLEVEGLPDGDPIATLRLSNAGVATSSVLKRRWSGPFGTAHHIIDPRTGLPVRSDLLTATVIAPRATTAEWAAKAVLISGAERGLVLAQAWGFAAIGLREDGTTVKNHAFLELEVKTRQ